MKILISGICDFVVVTIDEGLLDDARLRHLSATKWGARKYVNMALW